MRLLITDLSFFLSLLLYLSLFPLFIIGSSYMVLSYRVLSYPFSSTQLNLTNHPTYFPPLFSISSYHIYIYRFTQTHTLQAGFFLTSLSTYINKSQGRCDDDHEVFIQVRQGQGVSCRGTRTFAYIKLLTNLP